MPNLSTSICRLAIKCLFFLVFLFILSSSPANADDCCGCRLEWAPNMACTITNNGCLSQCPTATPRPAPTEPPPGVPTNTPPPGSTATPVPPGAPTPTEGVCNTTCDVDCTANATASVWSSWGWPASPLRPPANLMAPSAAWSAVL